MESWNIPEYEKESPSQGNIAHLQSIKRDGESLEDFEDITKDEPSIRNLTAQFLQFETGDRSKHQQEEFVFQGDNQFDNKPKNSNYIDVSPSNEGVSQTSKNFDNSVNLESPDSLKTSDREDSFNDLYVFEQTDLQAKSEDVEKTAEKPIWNILDENKLIDIVSTDEISRGSDDLSFMPKKGGSIPVLNSELQRDISKKPPVECKSNETTESSFNTQPLSKFTSEPGVYRKQEPETLQGDGLHVRKTYGAEVSDNDDDDDDDDFVPEPIPKDYPEIGAMEGKQFLVAMGLDSWFHPNFLHPKVESLIYWRDPKKSGIVFGGILIILLSLTLFSLISVVAYTSLTALVAALTFRIYKSVMQAVQKTSEGHPFKKYLVAVFNHPIITAAFNSIEEYLEIDLSVNPDKAREISDIAISHLNKVLTECRRLFLIEDVVDSLKFGVLLWILTYIGAWFNGLSLLIIAFVGLFTLPKVYENNKTQIDANVDLVKTKINEVTEKITAVIPLGKKTEEVKDKGE